MKKTLVRIQKAVPLTIFDEPTLSKKVSDLFNGAEKKLKARIKEIVKFLKLSPTDEISYENKQYNYCGECGCSCSCDGGCDGDTTKCTFKKICKHCCECYIASMLKNFSK